MIEPKLSVYVTDTTPLLNSEVFNYWYQKVSSYRREKIDGIKNQTDKNLSIGVEYLLMHACSDFGIDYQNVHITHNEFGKPSFENCAYHFNLSHSHSRAMCVISSNEVGCDVEKVREVKLDVAKRFFFEDEYQALEKCQTDHERAELFYKLWTLKESFMKCTGFGFHLPLNEFSVYINDKKVRIKQSVDNADYYLYNYMIDSYQYSWCIRGNEYFFENIQFKTLEIE